MPRDRVSAEDKQRIIDAYANGEDYVETARLLGVKRTTAWGIVRRYQLHGQVNRPRGGARNRKVDQEMIDQMIATVEEHPEFTLSQINNNLQETLPNKPRITDSTISKTWQTSSLWLKRWRRSNRMAIGQTCCRPDGNMELGYSMWSTG